MRTNVLASRPTQRTHEGGKAAPRQTAAEELERAVMSCLLFEDTFYESGASIAGRIAALAEASRPEAVYALAKRARTDWNLRHVPLWLLVQEAKRKVPKPGLAGAIAATVQRADELAEFVAMYWKDGRKPLPAQVKRGLGRAFGRFSAYQLAKWNRDEAVRLRDVMFLTHPKPTEEWQPGVWKKLAEGALSPPDTWEVALSSGADKKATWERLLAEHKLGIMALLMNLRNMEAAGVPRPLVASALAESDKSRAFPYRFLTAARHAPYMAQELSDAMLESCRRLPKLPGETHVVVDVSGSMDNALSSKSTSNRMDAASSLAVVAREVGDSCRVFTFSEVVVEVQNLRGISLAESIVNSQHHSGTYLGAALRSIKTHAGQPDRVIVVTDEQAHDSLPTCHARRRGYILNVAPYRPALPSKETGWTRLNGWSDRVLEWIALDEGVSHE